MAELAEQSTPRRNGKSDSAFRTISEVASELDLPQHVLRFWESKFPQVKPMKRGGGRRYYRPEDIELLRSIRDLLYNDGYTIKGVQKLLRQNGARSLAAAESRPSPADDAPTGDKARAGVDRAALEGILDELEAMRSLLKGTRG